MRIEHSTAPSSIRLLQHRPGLFLVSRDDCERISSSGFYHVRMMLHWVVFNTKAKDFCIRIAKVERLQPRS